MIWADKAFRFGLESSPEGLLVVIYISSESERERDDVMMSEPTHSREIFEKSSSEVSLSWISQLRPWIGRDNERANRISSHCKQIKE